MSPKSLLLPLLLGLWALSIISLGLDSLRASLYELRVNELRVAKAPIDLIARGTQRALELRPRNPESWRVSAEQSVSHEEAINAARESLRHGPARSRTWLLLAWRLVESGATGSDLDDALQQTAMLAPADRPLQLSLALMGLQYWAIGSDPAQHVWEAAIGHSLQYQQDTLKQEAVRRNLGAALCLGFVDRYDLDLWCQQQMSSPQRSQP